MRAIGPMVSTPLGNYTTTSYRISHDVLRSRSFGVTPEDDILDIAHNEVLDLSLLQLNPPDHTRLRRLAAPAFTPRRMESYRALVESAVGRLLDRAETLGEFDLMAALCGAAADRGDDPPARAARGFGEVPADWLDDCPRVGRRVVAGPGP